MRGSRRQRNIVSKIEELKSQGTANRDVQWWRRKRNVIRNSTKVERPLRFLTGKTLARLATNIKVMALLLQQENEELVTQWSIQPGTYSMGSNLKSSKSLSDCFAEVQIKPLMEFDSATTAMQKGHEYNSQYLHTYNNSVLIHRAPDIVHGSWHETCKKIENQ